MDESERRALARWRVADTRSARALTAAVIGFSKLVMRGLNRLEIEGLERFAALRERGRRGLLTFANHVSFFDDPLLISNFGVERYEEVRWVAADALNFFGDPVRAFVFGGGKCVPVVRGAGLDQPGFQFLVERLRKGDWVHFFPEGGRTRDPQARLRHPFKPGIGRLLAEARPLALPFYHYGMHGVLPLGSQRLRHGQTVRVRFGDAVDCDAAFVASTAREAAADPGPGLWTALAEWAYQAVERLQRGLHPAG